jgi:hypothetical protein|tara:strand:+ start:288 stop:563 length:276 start_codon:yes stop_codon:yes gene_type:complete
MIRTLLIAIFLTLFSQTAWADEVPDKGKYSAKINNTLDKNGADCRVATYSVIIKTASKIIFSIKCSSSSYLKGVEVTCAQTSTEQCFVSRY